MFFVSSRLRGSRQSRAALDPASLRLDQGVLKADGKVEQQERGEESEPRAGLRDERGKTWTNPRSIHNHSTISDLGSEAPLLLDFPVSTAHTFCQRAGTRSRTVHRVQPVRFFLRSQVSDSRRTSHMAAWQGMLACFEILRLIAQPATTGAKWLRPLYQLKEPS